jgi:REP element-mobilizing transposase RayT
MARKPRIEFAGAFYHVICRGNERQVIFRSDADRKYYLEPLEHYRQRYSFKVYAYVLMSNHVHMLIENRQSALIPDHAGSAVEVHGILQQKVQQSGPSVSRTLQSKFSVTDTLT